MVDTDSLATDGVWIGNHDKPIDLLDWASAFGIPRPTRPSGPLLDRLNPIEKSEAQPRTLSELYGRGAFPLHTDAAHHRAPPRLTVLRLATGTRKRRTLLLDWHQAYDDELHDLMRAGIWLVRSGRHRFYRPALDLPAGSQYRLRFDDGCMTPVTPRAHTAVAHMAELGRRREVRQVIWTKGMIMVLDNWRILHGRGPYPEQAKEDWTLERILLDPSPGLLP